MTVRHLYVHAPFCARRCSYCDFAVHVAASPPTDEWLDLTARELDTVAAAEGWTEPLRLDTLYIGGGTPSLLGAGAAGALLDRLRGRVGLEAAAEWTMEANPESFGAELAEGWRAAGVNRLSLGAQTFHEPALRWMGRLHGPDGPERAVALARRVGMASVSIDLIFGLPEHLGRDWGADLDRALELEPDHLSVYGLTAEAGTPLGRWIEQGREALADEARYEEEFLTAAERLTDAGYDHYEVSNFARPGHASRHNGAYWTGAAYLGLGVGAHSYLPPRRWWNTRDWAAYRSSVAAGRGAIESDERLDRDATTLERSWLGLRAAGIDARSLSAEQRALVDEWSGRGWAEWRDGRARLTRRGWLLLDRLAVELAERESAPVA